MKFHHQTESYPQTSRIGCHPPFADFEKLGDLALGELGLPAPADKSLVLPVAEPILVADPVNDSEEPVLGSIGFEDTLFSGSDGPPTLDGPGIPPLRNLPYYTTTCSRTQTNHNLLFDLFIIHP